MSPYYDKLLLSILMELHVWKGPLNCLRDHDPSAAQHLLHRALGDVTQER